MFDLEAAAADVIDVSLRLHRALGPGLLESVYDAVIAAKLQELGYDVDRQRPIAILFEGCVSTRPFGLISSSMTS